MCCLIVDVAVGASVVFSVISSLTNRNNISMYKEKGYCTYLWVCRLNGVEGALTSFYHKEIIKIIDYITLFSNILIVTVSLSIHVRANNLVKFICLSTKRVTGNRCSVSSGFSR